jgi:hypothetical protein
MGFSLKRALAGAVVGGAHAAGEVFDAQLKEAAADRARLADEERARRQAEYADELLANREARKQEMLDRREADKRKTYSETVKTVTAELKEKGVKIGSAEGQQAIGDAFANAGYPEFADKFFDNSQKARDTDSKERLKEIELQNLMETRREARAARADARQARIDAKKEAEHDRNALKRSEDLKTADKAYNKLLDDLDEKVVGDDGKSFTIDTTIKNFIRNNTFELSRTDPFAATKKAAELNEMVNEIKEDNPKASRFKITQLAEAEWRRRAESGRQAAEREFTPDGKINFNSARGAKPSPQLPTKSSRPETPIPGVTDMLGSNSDSQAFWIK